MNTMINATSKKILFLAGAVAVLVLVSCRGPNPNDAHGRKILTFAVSLLPDETTAYRAILNKFEDSTGTKVRLITQQYNDIRRTVRAESKAGRGQLDLVEMDVYYLHATKQLMVPINLEPETYAELTQDALRAGRFSDQQLFIPHRLNWQALVYNSLKIKTPPKTWDDLLSLAAENPGRFGFKASAYEGLTCDILPYLWQAGGDFLRPDSKAGRQTLEFLSKLSKYMNSSCRIYKEGTVLTALEQDEIYIHANWPFVVPQLSRKGLMPSKFRTAPLPRGPSGLATVLGGGYLAIPKTSPDPKGALALANFLVSSETQKKLVQKLGWFPVRAEGWDSLGSSDRELLDGFIAMQDHVRARPHLAEYEDISVVWQEGVRKILFKDKDVETTAKEMQRKIDRILKVSKG